MSKDDSNGGFLSKVVKFVRHPTTSWSDLDTRSADRESEYSKAALKEMIAYPGPYVLDVEVPYQEHVLPMIPAGMTVKDLIKE